MPTVRTWAYRALVFLSSFLLFEIELIAAKLLLPRFGSSASVWSTSLVFFQGALLLGYLLAARVTRTHGWRWQHLLVVALPALALPLHLPQLHFEPVLAVGATLAVAVGLPFVALSTTSVVLQRWLHDSGLERAKDPVFLYGLSNGGALLALLSYPTLVEPALDLHAQLWLWYAGYGLFVLLHLLCVPPRVTEAPSPAATVDPAAPREEGRSTRWAWLLLPAAGNALLMAATNALTSDATVPLLWVLPLSVYLVTLILCFAPWPLHPRLQDGLSLLALGVAVAGMLMMRGRTHFELGAVFTHDAFLLVGCLLVFAAVSRLRPTSVNERGAYFFAQSLGGFLGSAVVGLLLPALGAPFAYYDYLAAGALLVIAFTARDFARLRAWAARAAWRPPLVGAAALGLAGLLVLAGHAGTAASLDATRTFYGLYRVYQEGPLRYFRHGATTHGVEDQIAPRRAALVLSPRLTGGAAAGDRLPEARRGAGGPRRGFARRLRAAGREVDLLRARPRGGAPRAQGLHLPRLGQGRRVGGDGRRAAVAAQGGRPQLRPDGARRLLERLRAAAPDFARGVSNLPGQAAARTGCLVVHVSSRIFDLIPVLTRLAADAGTPGAYAIGDDGEQRGAYASIWFALARDADRIAPLQRDLGWRRLELTPALAARRPWSDDYVNLFHALK